MGLIKAQTPTRMPVVPFSMKDIERQAQGLLAQAQERCDALLAEAQKEAQQLKAQAIEQGRAEGHRDGLAQGLQAGRASGHEQALAEHRQQLTDAVGALAAAMVELDTSRHRLEAEALTEVIELAVAVAQRITRRQGAFDAQVLIANLADAMKVVVHAADVRIAVNPAQRAVLEDAMPRLRLQWPNLKHLEVLEDPAVAAGGCRIHTQHGMVDADLGTQLDRIVAELLPEPSQPAKAGDVQVQTQVAPTEGAAQESEA